MLDLIKYYKLKKLQFKVDDEMKEDMIKLLVIKQSLESSNEQEKQILEKEFNDLLGKFLIKFHKLNEKQIKILNNL